MASKYLLDSSALLALMFEEPGSERVASYLAESAMSAVNLAEVVAKIYRLGGDGAAAAKHVLDLTLPILPYDAALFDQEILRALPGSGLSIGDRICLMTARRLGLVAVTSDRRWMQLQLPGLEIDLIRNRRA